MIRLLPVAESYARAVSKSIRRALPGMVLAFLSAPRAAGGNAG